MTAQQISQVQALTGYVASIQANMLALALWLIRRKSQPFKSPKSLPITACGLRLSDEAMRVAVGLRLGLNICEPHPCPCEATITSRGTHGLSCNRSSGCSTRHQQINNAIWRALKHADVPSTKESAGLLRGDGKRPNGLTLVPWQSGRSLTWDVTVVDTLASSYTPSTSVTPCESLSIALPRSSHLASRASLSAKLSAVHPGVLPCQLVR